MTDGEILMMKSGRELDIKVAEDVVGCAVVRDAIFGDMLRIDNESAWMPLPAYSEDQSTIPELLEMLKRFHRTEIDHECFQGRWEADMNVCGEGINYYYPDFNAFSLPEAICKAALLVVHGNMKSEPGAVAEATPCGCQTRI